MRAIPRSFTILTTAALLAAAPAFAAGNQPVPEQSPSEADRITDQIELEKARTDLANARLETLRLNSDTTGTTEVSDSGGEFEGWLMSANAIDTAAGRIADRLRTDHPGAALVLLAGDEALDLGLPRAMRDRLRVLENQATAALTRAGCVRPSDERAVGAFPVAAALPYLGALIGAFRTDTDITGFAGPTEARLIVNSLAARVRSSDNWFVPASIVSVPTVSELATKWEGVAETRREIAECRQLVTRQRDTPERTRRLADLDSASNGIDGFETTNIVGTAGGVSPFVQAIRYEALANAPDLRVVRLHVEKSGGSVLVRRNLWTMLGAPAVGISGGAVVGWRISDASSGRLLGGGNLSCRTELSNMRAIQDGRVRGSSCDYRRAAAAR